MSSLPTAAGAGDERTCSPPPLIPRPAPSPSAQATEEGNDEISSTPRPKPTAEMCQLAPGPSQLSASRPPVPQPPSVALSALQLDDSRPSSPLPTPGLDGSSSRAGAAAGDVPSPTLLSTLTANDGESILVLCVDEEPNTTRASTGGGLSGTAGAGTEMGRVYGGSQGGAIHVCLHPVRPLAFGAPARCPTVRSYRGRSLMIHVTAGMGPVDWFPPCPSSRSHGSSTSPAACQGEGLVDFGLGWVLVRHARLLLAAPYSCSSLFPLLRFPYPLCRPPCPALISTSRSSAIDV